MIQLFVGDMVVLVGSEALQVMLLVVSLAMVVKAGIPAAAAVFAALTKATLFHLQVAGVVVLMA